MTLELPSLYLSPEKKPMDSFRYVYRDYTIAAMCVHYEEDMKKHLFSGHSGNEVLTIFQFQWKYELLSRAKSILTHALTP